MSDPDNTEDRLRLSLHSHADAVQVEPDSSGLFERTARDSVHRRRRLGALSVIAVVLVGAAGVLGGQALASSGTKQTTASLAQSPPPRPRPAARAAGGDRSQRTAEPPLHSHDRRRITIRAYVGQAETAPTCENGCTPAPGTTSTTGAGQPHADVVAARAEGRGRIVGHDLACASTGTGSLPVMTVPLTPVSPVSTTTTVGAGAGPRAPLRVREWGDDVHLSARHHRALDRRRGHHATAAVETPVAGQLVVEASGVFGTAEGNPASWVLVATGSDVASVRLGGAGSDTMTPVDGLAVLAVTGARRLRSWPSTPTGWSSPACPLRCPRPPSGVRSREPPALEHHGALDRASRFESRGTGHHDPDRPAREQPSGYRAPPGRRRRGDDGRKRLTERAALG